MGRGIRMICQLYGGIVINGKKWIWDYAQDKAIPESDLIAEQKAEQDKQKAENLKAKAIRIALDLEDGKQ